MWEIKVKKKDGKEVYVTSNNIVDKAIDWVADHAVPIAAISATSIMLSIMFGGKKKRKAPTINRKHIKQVIYTDSGYYILTSQNPFV